MTRLIRTKAAAIALAVAGVFAAAQDAAAQSNEIFIPVLVYRTGAYAPNGVPWADGFVDYLKLVNERDGGVNGVKIASEECETGYATDRGVECYERLKSKKPVAYNPLSTGITFALTEKAPADKVPIFTIGYGRADSADGAVFAWNFPLLGTYWSAADILVQHVKKKGSLKAKKEEVGTVLYNRGMISALLVVESIRVAQAHTKKKVVTGEDVRWGAEHLNLDSGRIKALGIDGMMQPLKTSCADHEGVRKARI